MADRRTSHVYQALTRARLLAGAEYPLAVSNLLFSMVFVFALHFWYWIIVTYLIHKVLQLAAKKDPLMRQMFITYSHQGDTYTPWPSSQNVRGLRPRNLGRGNLW